MPELAQLPWTLIEKGNTQKGVNFRVLKFLHQYFQGSKTLSSLLDAPCGQGEFLKAVKQFFPKAELEGQDLFASPLPEIKQHFRKGDLKVTFTGLDDRKFDVITCISGVMVFDHVSGFIENASRHTKTEGLFVLTNDNILTVRDRLSFLFFGRLKRFKLHYSVEEGNWNVLLVQALWKLLRLNKFEVIKVEYCSYYAEDILFLPLALILFPIWWMFIHFGKGEMDAQTRKQLFPFAALLARHYIIYSRKLN